MFEAFALCINQISFVKFFFKASTEKSARGLIYCVLDSCNSNTPGVILVDPAIQGKPIAVVEGFPVV